MSEKIVLHSALRQEHTIVAGCMLHGMWTHAVVMKTMVEIALPSSLWMLESKSDDCAWWNHLCAWAFCDPEGEVVGLSSFDIYSKSVMATNGFESSSMSSTRTLAARSSFQRRGE
ncbi:hypothetical protein EWB00_001815 [Schistosoma japonicum]|uniref:Uncharacterized protein n=1 Tax=Schistosoma japonicum TaxID=6182 RepID=A0A4Z2CJU5_SCHJA|nr:hypothetical protein EWB00_001815 [Schistosoma japonicum]